jgi:hypothetical protein
MHDIKLFKLISGEEIIAKVTSFRTVSGNEYVLEDVVSLVYQPTNDGRMTTGFAPFMPYAEGEIALNQSAVVSSTSELKQQILDEYNRVFSKIQIAPASVLASR